jgi:hypothetical protein
MVSSRLVALLTLTVPRKEPRRHADQSEQQERDHDVVPGGQIQRPLSIIRRDIACNNLDDAAKRYGVVRVDSQN